MNDWTHWIVPAAVAAILVLLTEGAKHFCIRRWRSESATLPDGRPQPKPFFLGLLIPPVVILVLTPLALGLMRLSSGLAADLARYANAVTAWRVFWTILFFVNGAECVMRFFFYLRNRRFPVPTLLRNILHFVIVVGVLMLVSKHILGHDISTALASTAIVTAVVGFALQGVLGNLLAGISLHIVRAAMPGDWVAIGKEVEGEVISGNWRETQLRTLEGHYLAVPNSLIATSVINNMSYPNRERDVELEVGASYEDAPADVIEALQASATGVPGVLAKPAPVAVLAGYGDFGINYKLFYSTDHYERRVFTSGAVLARIWYEFKRRGINIPFPLGDNRIDSAVTLMHQAPSHTPDAGEIDALVDDLLHSDVVGTLLMDADGKTLVSEVDIRGIATSFRRVRYTKTETLFRQGEPGDSAYVLVKGSLEGTILDPGTRRVVHRFAVKPGEFVGEMCLLTGCPRTATVVATGESELIAISQQAFARLLALRPGIPEHLADLAARRTAQNEAKRKAFDAAAPEVAQHKLTILARFKALLSHVRRG